MKIKTEKEPDDKRCGGNPTGIADLRSPSNSFRKTPALIQPDISRQGSVEFHPPKIRHMKNGNELFANLQAKLKMGWNYWKERR